MITRMAMSFHVIDHHSLDIVHYKDIYDTWDYIEISCDISDIKCDMTYGNELYVIDHHSLDIVHSKDI